MLVAHGGYNVSAVGLCFYDFLAADIAVLQAFLDCLTVSRPIAVGDVVDSQKVERRGKTVNNCRCYCCCV